MALDERKLAFIGAGHITNVIVDNLVNAEKVYTHRLIASDPDKDKLQRLYDKYEMVLAKDNLNAVEMGDFGVSEVCLCASPRAIVELVQRLQVNASITRPHEPSLPRQA